ncbi:MAG: hypothetical protein ABIK37_04645 [candidate division WOR-3 bacterium]
MRQTMLLVLLGVVGIAMAGQGTGLGVIAGEPTGVSAKLWLSDFMAVDAAAAWSVVRYAALHVHADVLYHNTELLKVPVGELPAYLGVGGRFKVAGGDHYKARIGLRVPVGLEYLFDGVPLGVFMEVAPVFDLVPETQFDFNGGVGARWYFR